MNRIFLFILTLFFYNSLIGQEENSDYLSKWTEALSEFSHRRTSNLFTLEKIQDSSKYLLDTARGIGLLAKTPIYSENKKRNSPFFYTHTYLPYAICDMTDYLYDDKSSTVIPAINYPYDLIKIYFITSLFYSDFCFKEKIKVGTKNNQYVFQVKQEFTVDYENNLKMEAPLLEKVYKDVQIWVEELEQKGLEQMRKENKPPLYYSDLKFYAYPSVSPIFFCKA